MDLVKYIIEYDGSVIINKEYPVEIKKNRPLCLEWFKGNEITTDPAPEKIIKIKPDLFILRPKKQKEEKTETIKTQNAEVQKLDTVLGHVRITKFKNGEVEESYIAAADFTPPTQMELPFAFLQCVGLGDFENAQRMLNFETSSNHLKNFFGEFELLVNNYLPPIDDDTYAISILPKDSFNARTFIFKTEGNKIINIEPDM